MVPRPRIRAGSRARRFWARALELEPDVRRALVQAPPAGLGVHDAQSPAADLLKVLLVDDPLEAGALIDHLDQQAVVLERRSRA